MTVDRDKVSVGPNNRPLNLTIAGTGPGIPDEALAPEEELLEGPADKVAERNAQ